MKPTAYVINLDHRVARWEKMQKLWSPFFELVGIPGVYLPGNGAAGCKMSHQMVASHFLEKEEPIIVIEDDSEPDPAFAVTWPSAFIEAKHFIRSWDYINCSPWLDLSSINLPRARLSVTEAHLFLKSSYSHNTNFVLYNRRSLHLLNDAMHSPLPLDMFLGCYAKNQWVPIRLLARQDDSPGDIAKPIVDAKQLYALSEQMIGDFLGEKKRQMLEDAVNEAKV